MRLCGEETSESPEDPGVAGGSGERAGETSEGAAVSVAVERRDTLDVGDATADRTAAGTGEGSAAAAGGRIDIAAAAAAAEAGITLVRLEIAIGAAAAAEAEAARAGNVITKR